MKKSFFFALLSLSLLNSMSSFGCSYLELYNRTNESDLDVVVRIFDGENRLTEADKKCSISENSMESFEMQKEATKAEVDCYKKGEKTVRRKLEINKIGGIWRCVESTKDGMFVEKAFSIYEFPLGHEGLVIALDPL